METLANNRTAKDLLSDWIKDTKPDNNLFENEILSKELDLLDQDILSFISSNRDKPIDLDRLFRLQTIRLLISINTLLFNQTKICNNYSGDCGNSDDNG